MSDLIERQAAVDAAIEAVDEWDGGYNLTRADMIADAINNAVPSAQPEPLTDKEQRIFLAAMAREEKVCEEVDRNYVREPYEDSLVRTCHEIIRKVKGALWA